MFKNEVFNKNTDINYILEDQIIYSLEKNISRIASYSFIILICAGVEEAIRLLQKDGIKIFIKKNKKKYGDYLKRSEIFSINKESFVQDFNDIFELRNWIVHRNGRINIQKLSKIERDLLKRNNKNIKIRNMYLEVEHDYIYSLATRIEDILKCSAEENYK